jgi:cellulose synthase/poly-beta-1,6-N-acetylglucosamine synthase-like glycosyltransferase
MSVLEVDLSFIFVVAVILIWFMIAYQFVLTVFGYINYVRSLRQKRVIDGKQFEYPSCTIMIPAHNEERVISRTLDAMLRLDYPEYQLKILVINDGSTDRTKEVVTRYSERDPRIEVYNVPPGEGGRGKSRALNLGLRRVTTEVFAVYDADNTPDSAALRYLIAHLLTNPSLGGAIGKFRTSNKDASLLTKFINIETLSFQSMLQAGRWQMHNITTLPGTNFVMWTWLIRRLNGWDEEALTEDSELSIRVYQEGFKIAFVPYALTFEQEPQEWGVWVRQRTRWVRGNNYVLGKFIKHIPQFKSKRLMFDVLYTLLLYYVFFIAIVVSDALFIVSALNLVSIALPGPYTFVWIMAFFLFLCETVLTISYDGEDRLRHVPLLVLMYFTYCQFWIYVVLRALWIEYVRREKRTWDKTIRFDVSIAELPARAAKKVT